MKQAVRFTIHDEVRLLELFSALNLFAWAKFFGANPDILQRDSYRGFGGESATFWMWCFGLISLIQAASLLNDRWHALEGRFLASALAAGAWTVVAWNFWSTGISTTANLNYSLLALACAISGVWLGWKTTSSQS